MGGRIASIQVRGKADKKSYLIQFYFHGRRQSLKLGRVAERTVNAKAAKIEEFLVLLERGMVQLPPGMDVVEFVKHDGKAPAEPVVRFGATLGVLRDRYLAACRGSLESNTVALLEIHFRHLVRTFGEKLLIGDMDLALLQKHTDRRKAEVSATTIRKELVTLRSAWHWGVPMKLVSGLFPPLKNVKLPKADEQPPFMCCEDSCSYTARQTTWRKPYARKRRRPVGLGQTGRSAGRGNRLALGA